MRPLEGLLAVLLLVGVVLHVSTAPDYAERNVEYFPDMAESPGYEAQDPNPNFTDGMTLRTPAPGTRPRGFRPLLTFDGRPLEATTPDWKALEPGERADWDRLVPNDGFEALDDAGKARSAARGRHVFESVCAACHGENGLAGTPVTKRGVPPPPSLLEQNARRMSDGQIYRIITVGQGNMPAHANLVTRADRWPVVRHVRKLQESKP